MPYFKFVDLKSDFEIVRYKAALTIMQVLINFKSMISTFFGDGSSKYGIFKQISGGKAGVH